MGLEDWKNKTILVRYDDRTTNGASKEGKLLDVNGTELIVQTQSGNIAIPRDRLIRVELLQVVSHG